MNSSLIWSLLENHLGKNFAKEPSLQQTVKRLSDVFTGDRSSQAKNYFEDPKLGKAYLAYFLPLNFEKTHTILRANAKALTRSLGQKTEQTWVDYGCGPASASLAALYVASKVLPKTKKIQIDLVDSQKSALKMASTLLKACGEMLNIEVTTKCFSSIKEISSQKYDLSLAANILNELPPTSSAQVR